MRRTAFQPMQHISDSHGMPTAALVKAHIKYSLRCDKSKQGVLFLSLKERLKVDYAHIVSFKCTIHKRIDDRTVSLVFFFFLIKWLQFLFCHLC